MREINKIIIHCSDSDIPSHDNIDAVRQWHMDRGWNGVGYHFFIQKNGNIEEGRPLVIAGAHCKGHNKDSVGICLSGKKEFTDAQMDSLYSLVQKLCSDHYIHPRSVYPHNKFNKNKTCPNFELPDFYIGSKREKLDEDFPRDYDITQGGDCEC
jgi:hypothetical protein